MASVRRHQKLPPCWTEFCDGPVTGQGQALEQHLWDKEKVKDAVQQLGEGSEKM